MLTIITPIYRESRFLNKFFDAIEEQTSNNYELILVVDTNNEDILSIIDQHIPHLKGSIKVMFNSKRIGRQQAILNATTEATGNYTLIVSVSDRFDENMIKSVLAIVKKQPSDIIEFRARLKDPIKFVGEIKHKVSKPVSIDSKKEVIARMYPFEFNKIFNTPKLKKASKLPSIKSSFNSRNSAEILLRMIKVSETYSNVDVPIIRSLKHLDNTFNPLRLFREWKQLIGEEILEEYVIELQFTLYAFSKVFLEAFIVTTKNKLLTTKFQALVDKYFGEKTNFYDLNKYFISNDELSVALRNNRSKTSGKVYKSL